MFTSFPLENRMLSITFNWLLNISLAILILFFANLGKILGIQSIDPHISLVWPASGIALAAVLLFGYKTWVGIFLGNLLYDYSQLYSGTNAFIVPLIVALTISVGSTLQALVGGYVIRKFSSPRYFTTVKDVFIFLIPGTLFVCMIASSIGTIALYFAGGLQNTSSLLTWFTFWLGDFMGIYVFTPLIVVWMLFKPKAIKEHDLEFFLMVVSFLVILLLTFVWNLPPLHLFVPMTLWATYRYGMHGATTSVLLVAVIATVVTGLGYGALNVYLVGDKLLILAGFIGTTVATCLTFAAIINERSAAWASLHAHNVNLKEALDLSAQELKEIHNNLFIKDKLASLGSLAIGVSNRIEKPLKSIATSIREGMDKLLLLKASIQEPKDQKYLDSIEDELNAISKSEASIGKILEVARNRAVKTTPEKIKCEYINLHTLINMCLDKISTLKNKRDPEFTFNTSKQYDSSVKSILVLPEDLEYVLMHFFDNALDAMQEKKQKLKENYTPSLSIQTINYDNKVEIIIKDNGIGISDDKLENFFLSFISTKHPEEASGLNLALAHDIIVHIHHGDIQVDSKEGEFCEIRFSLPKN
jgi:signal transduction histidine kinase